MRPMLIVTTALVALVTGVPTAAAAAEDSWKVPAQASITVHGHGYGHGHGMSQYGAEGAAREGRSAAQILDFYYPGTTMGRRGGRVSVLISADTTDDLVVRSRKGLRVRDLGSRRTTRLPRSIGGRTPAVWRLKQNHRDRTRLSWRTASGGSGSWTKLRDLRGHGELSAGNAPVTLVTPAGDRAYRGRLRALPPSRGSAARDTVNKVRLDDYLRGVVPLEIPASWSQAAVRAQAVAARSYAVFERRSPRAAHYQLCDTSACQVYGGVRAEHPGSDAAVAATAKQVRLADGQPAFTQFSSSSGGWTAAGSRPYLAAKPDPYDDWAGNPHHDWSVRLTDARIETAFPAVGDLRSIKVQQRDGNGQWGGRVGSVRLAGTDGQVTVSGDALRFGLGLRSPWVTFRVRRR